MSKLAYLQSSGSMFDHPNLFRRSSQILHILTTRSHFRPLQWVPFQQQQQHNFLFSGSKISTRYSHQYFPTRSLCHPRQYSSRRESTAPSDRDTVRKVSSLDISPTHGKLGDVTSGRCDTEAPVSDPSESATAIARRKKKVAIWLAYLGTGYHGEKVANQTITMVMMITMIVMMTQLISENRNKHPSTSYHLTTFQTGCLFTMLNDGDQRQCHYLIAFMSVPALDPRTPWTACAGLQIQRTSPPTPSEFPLLSLPAPSWILPHCTRNPH